MKKRTIGLTACLVGIFLGAGLEQLSLSVPPPAESTRQMIPGTLKINRVLSRENEIIVLDSNGNPRKLNPGFYDEFFYRMTNYNPQGHGEVLVEGFARNGEGYEISILRPEDNQNVCYTFFFEHKGVFKSAGNSTINGEPKRIHNRDAGIIHRGERKLLYLSLQETKTGEVKYYTTELKYWQLVMDNFHEVTKKEFDEMKRME